MNPVTLLSQADLHAALHQRHSGAKSFPERDTYVGASEVGSCLRLVAWRKLHPEFTFDAKAAGRMRAGQVLENEAVQMVRLALGGAVRGTGAAQEEVRFPDAPLRVHPDGRILRDAFRAILASGAEILVLRGDGTLGPLATLPEGDGVLEIKTSSSYGIRAVKKSGLSLAYDGQTQVEMAGFGVSWGLLVMVSREDLSDALVVFLEADPAKAEAMKDRARNTMACVDRIREGLITEDAGLPEAETDRGYCSSCPIADSCPALVAARSLAGEAAALPPDAVDEVEAMAEEIMTLAPEAKRHEAVKDALKARLLDLSCLNPSLPSGLRVKLAEVKGREALDAKALKAKYPAIAVELTKRGENYFTLSVKEKTA